MAPLECSVAHLLPSRMADTGSVCPCTPMPVAHFNSNHNTLHQIGLSNGLTSLHSICLQCAIIHFGSRDCCDRCTQSHAGRLNLSGSFEARVVSSQLQAYFGVLGPRVGLISLACMATAWKGKCIQTSPLLLLKCNGQSDSSTRLRPIAYGPCGRSAQGKMSYTGSYASKQWQHC